MTTGWKYNLNAVKDIKVTKDFLARIDKGCTTEPSNSLTSVYVDKIIQECGCLPLTMIYKENVS